MFIHCSPSDNAGQMGDLGLRGEARARLRRVRAAARTALTPPELDGAVSERFMGLGHGVRVAVGLFALVVVPFFPGLRASDRLLLAGLIAGFYLPYALVIGRLSRSSPRFATRLSLVLGDIVVVFLFAAVVPETRVVALFGYLLLVAFHTFLGGLGLGLVVTAGIVSLGVAAEVLATERMLSDYTLGMFAVVSVLLAVIVDSATRERRQAARFLARLQRAIGEVSATPSLDETLDSVVAAARRAVDAKFASVIVRDADDLVQGALEGDHHPDPKERSAEIIERILADPMASPSGIAITTGERVVVPDIGKDPRFAPWIDETRRQQFTSTVAVPLRAGRDVIGVLSAYFPHPSLVSTQTVELLTAYAEHVTLVILRALAYEHEKAAARRLMEADAIKSELVATVSHELRTPLTAVKGFVETLARHWDRFDDDQRRELLGRSLRNADQLAALIDQVLDFSRLEAGMVEIEADVLELEHEIPAVLEACAHVIGEHPLLVDVEPSLRARGDREAFKHVLTNLVSNAAKYSDDDAPIRVTASGNGEVVVAVADAGPGIPPAEQERIFDRFYRSPGARASRGTGIGLAIVKRYVELMGGRVSIESEEGAGSTFSFSLPVSSLPVGAQAPEPSEGLDVTVPDSRQLSDAR